LSGAAGVRGQGTGAAAPLLSFRMSCVTTTHGRKWTHPLRVLAVQRLLQTSPMTQPWVRHIHNALLVSQCLAYSLHSCCDDAINDKNFILIIAAIRILQYTIVEVGSHSLTGHFWRPGASSQPPSNHGEAAPLLHMT